MLIANTFTKKQTIALVDGAIIADLISAMRPKQWMKNFVLFAGILFSQNLFNLYLFAVDFAAFIIFIVLSSAIYLINDVNDIESDRLHPIKRYRPIAAGRISPVTAVISSTVFAILALTAAFTLSFRFGLVALAYYGMMQAYSLGLKRIVILDVMIIALGFVLRAIAGAVVVGVSISPWLLLCIIFFSLLLAFGKRRQELVSLGSNAKGHRANLGEYSAQFLDYLLTALTALTIISYIFYTLAPRTVATLGTSNLVYTIPFVVFAILRYFYLVQQKNLGGRPEGLLSADKQLFITAFLWSVTSGIIIYFV